MQYGRIDRDGGLAEVDGMCGVWCGVDRSLKLEAVACAWCLVLGAWYYIDMVWYHTICS